MSIESTEPIDFGEHLAGMRKAYGDRIDLPKLGMSAFATLLGISAVVYEAYECGDRAPTADFMALLRNKTGADLD